MRSERTIKFVIAMIVVILAIALQLVGPSIGPEFVSWWLILNTVPYLLGFAVDLVAHQSPELGFYGGLAFQWFLLGYLVGDITTNRMKRRTVETRSEDAR